PQNTSLPGLFRASEVVLADELGWPLEDFRRCWAEIEGVGMARADWKARVVWVPNAVKYNEPANPNVVKSWADLLGEVPDCPLKAEACQALAGYLAARPALAGAVATVFGTCGAAGTVAQTVPATEPATAHPTVPGTVPPTVPGTVEGTDSRISSSSSNSKEPPPTPSGGTCVELPGEGQEGEEDLRAVAEAVVEQYQKQAKPAHASGGGADAVVALLRD